MNLIIGTAVCGIIMMMLSIITRNIKLIEWVAILLSITLIGVAIYDANMIDGSQTYFNNLIELNPTNSWFNILMMVGACVYIFFFHNEITKIGASDAEYFALIFFVLSGVVMITTFNNFLTLFIGIEIMSIPQYILAGSDKRNLKSTEASLKYFLMGAFSTGFLLMGITLIYGATGSFALSDFAFIASNGLNTLTLLGLFFILIAMAFKVSAAPFHIWTADLYDGAPTPFTPFMASIVKAAAFFAFVRLFNNASGQVLASTKVALTFIICLTLLIGNITAVYQQSVKRMLAYSSIAQAGFMLFAVYAHNKMASTGILLYAMVYVLATVGIFAVLIKMKDYTYDGFNGLAKTQPVLAFTATVCMLSLAGIPLTGGFLAKYYMLNSAIISGMPIWLLVFALLMAAVSVYYYFKLIMAMYFHTGEPQLTEQPTQDYKLMLIINAIALIVLGILPGVVAR